MLLPTRRTADILEQITDKELMIYDLKIDKAYCLNETCAVIFNHCDGWTTFDRLRRKSGYSDELIHFALGELHRMNLVENAENDYFAGLSRREVIKKVGLSSLVAIPLISSLAAPRATHAASGLRANGASCNNSNQCTNNRCGQQGFGPSCCSSNDFGVCSTPADCCSGVACTNRVCCQGTGRTCDTRSPNQCCQGLTCVAPAGQFNGSCQ